MERVEYDDFAKLDIRVAKVLSAEPFGEKLFKMLLDVGEEKRTVLAGIRGHYSPEDLVGKAVVMIFKLKPRKILGVESQGMLLAADSGEVVSLLSPDREVPPGTRVR